MDTFTPKSSQKAMSALLLIWDLTGTPIEVFQKLRNYITRESWARYANRADLIQKVWFSSEKDAVFGAFYLWATVEAMEGEIRNMYRVEAMTGVAPSIHPLQVEAIQEGQHHITDLLSIGLAWKGSAYDPTT